MENVERRHAPSGRTSVRVRSIALVAAALAASCSVTAAETSTTTTSASTAPPPVTLRLDADGLGDVAFGLDPDSVIAAITPVAGGPDRDSGWIDPDAIYGRCPGGAVRAIGWGSLLALFTAGEPEDGDPADGDATFFAYTYGFDDELGTVGSDPYELGLTTDRGIGLASTRTDVRNAYGDLLDEQGDPVLDVWTFTIGRPSPNWRGQFSGPADDARVIFIASLPGCESRDR